jgi:hypothetical protein
LGQEAGKQERSTGEISRTTLTLAQGFFYFDIFTHTHTLSLSHITHTEGGVDDVDKERDSRAARGRKLGTSAR